MTSTIKNLSIYVKLLSILVSLQWVQPVQATELSSVQSEVVSPKVRFKKMVEKPAWMIKGSASMRAYVGSTLQYYESNVPGRYHGADLSIGYEISKKARLGAAVGIENSPDQYREEDIDHKNDVYQATDINLSVNLPEIVRFREDLSISSSVSGFYPLSRASREHDLTTTLNNSWDMRWVIGDYSVGPRLGYSRNFYRYTEQMTEVRRGDSVGSSHTKEFASMGLSFSMAFFDNASLSAFYGVTRIYPYTGEFFHLNTSQATFSYAFEKLVPYVSVRTAASQLNHDNRINYAIFEKNRSRGEVGVSYGF